MSLPKWGADSEDESHEDLHLEKNVLELLHQYASQAHEKVSFKWDSVGTASLPGFICRLTVGSAVYIGAGSSKKSAKYSAAKAAVDARASYVAPAIAEPSTKDVCTPDGQNPISVLNDLLARRKMPLPDYVVVTERIVGSRTAYTMGCRVGNLMEKGSGLCKKTAKQEAALKMLKKLKEEEKPVPVPVARPDHRAEPLSKAPGRAKSIRGRVSPYPGTTRPFPENRRGGSAHPFNTTPGKNELHPPRPVLPNTRPIRESGYDVQGALNTDATRPPMGNQRCYNTQEFNRGPIDHAQYPPAQEFNRELIAHSQYPLAPVIPNTEPIRPHMELRQDRSAPEMHPALGHNAQHQWTPGPLNTATVRPLMANHHSAQELGGNARFSLTPASLSSGMVRILLASQQDLGAQGLNSTEGCEEEYIWARVSKITGTAALFLEQKANLKPEETNAGPERNAGLRGTFVTLKPAGTLDLPLDQLEDPSSPESNAAPGTNAGCTLSSPNLIPPGPHLDDNQTFCKNAGATWAQSSMSHPGMFKTTLENMQYPNIQALNSAPGKCVVYGVRWPFSFSDMPRHF